MDMFYVSMTDNFLSYWGKASGKIDKLVFICNTEEEANIVKFNARCYSSMSSIVVSNNKPVFPENNYYVTFKNKNDSPNWYIKNFFLGV